MKSIADVLQQASEAYYNGAPIMSDAEYDAIRDMFVMAEPEHPVLKAVGAAPVSEWPKFTHPISMGSLNKVQTIPELTSWWPNEPMCLTEKIDGISCLLVYENGLLTVGATRGDGSIGENITPNVRQMQGVLSKIQNSTVAYVRGEIVITKPDFETSFKGESNPRNSASGTAKRRSNTEKCKHLTFLAYYLEIDGEIIPTKHDEFLRLRQLGFKTPSFTMVQSVQDVDTIYQAYIGTRRAKLEYEIDGLVLDINDRSKRVALGIQDMRPKGSIALKFPHDSKPTTLLDIRWQVGPSGRITPVAVFELIVLGGAEVRQATLHNAKRVLGLNLYKGAQILVSRRNDVIPGVEANLSENIFVRDLE